MAFNHDRLVPLARYRSDRESNTLSWEVDDYGVKVRFEKPNTTLGNDVAEMINRGDVSGMSFAFSADKDGEEWERMEDGGHKRVVKRMNGIYDFSVVTSPAYQATDVSVIQRHAEEVIEAEEAEKRAEADRIKAEIERDADTIKRMRL
jgi:HK97 family phage prohead protease